MVDDLKTSTAIAAVPANAADVLTPEDEANLAEDTKAIQMAYNDIRAKAVDIGNRLTKWQDALSHGKWLCWIETNFDFSDQTARNLINLAALAKSKPVLDLPIDLSGLYILAAPSTPAAAVDEVIETAKTKKVTKKAVKAVVAKHKTAPAPELAKAEPKGKSPSKPRSPKPQASSLEPKPPVSRMINSLEIDHLVSSNAR